MKSLISFILILSYFTSINAKEESEPQQSGPTGTEIVLADIDFKKGKPIVSNAQNITNRAGYDSQPAFMDKDKAIYFTRFIDNQTDIYKFDLKSKKLSPFMQTPESEYSATPIAGRKGISVVRVELKKGENDQAIQHVRWLHKDRKTNHSDLMSDLDTIGYHNWTGKNKLWMFIINEDQGDLYYQTIGKKPKLIASKIGRSIKTDAKMKNVYYVDKSTDAWSIIKINAKNFKKSKILELPEGVEDFAIDSKGNFWCGQNNTLYFSKKGKIWTIVKEFDLPGIANISRVDVNTKIDKIALVFNENKKIIL